MFCITLRIRSNVQIAFVKELILKKKVDWLSRNISTSMMYMGIF